MNIIELKKIIEYRMSLENNDDCALMDCWKKEVLLLSENISDSIDFLTVCTDIEFYWISEVFDDLIATTQSRELFQAICERLKAVENPEIKASIITDLEYAKEQFEK